MRYVYGVLLAFLFFQPCFAQPSNMLHTARRGIHRVLSRARKSSLKTDWWFNTKEMRQQLDHNAKLFYQFFEKNVIAKDADNVLVHVSDVEVPEPIKLFVEPKIETPLLIAEFKF